VCVCARAHVSKSVKCGARHHHDCNSTHCNRKNCQTLQHTATFKCKAIAACEREWEIWCAKTSLQKAMHYTATVHSANAHTATQCNIYARNHRCPKPYTALQQYTVQLYILPKHTLQQYALRHTAAHTLEYNVPIRVHAHTHARVRALTHMHTLIPTLAHAHI